MRYNVIVEDLRGAREHLAKEAAAARIAHYLDLSGDVRTDSFDWDYRVFIQEQHGNLRLEELRIEWPWTFCVTVLHPGRLEVRWRETGVTAVDRGVAFDLDGVERELERFLRQRRYTGDAPPEFQPPGVADSWDIAGPPIDSATAGHVFISYVSEDSAVVDRLESDLKAAGVRVWRDRSSLGPGDRWKQAIRHAIESGTYFLCCFSEASGNRRKSYMNEELTVAIEELRARRRDQVWFLPVVLPGGEIPDSAIGAGESLRDFNYTMLLPDTWSDGVRRLVSAIQREPKQSSK